MTAATEFLINTTTNGNQWYSDVTALADGGFVVVWQSDSSNGLSHDIYGQRYSSTGALEGPEFHINADSQNAQVEPAITALADGGFMVMWTSTAEGYVDIHAQRYTSAGTTAGAEFRVNALTGASNPALTTLADGGFVVTWTASAAASKDIRAQRFNSAGTAVGDEFLVNTTTINNQMTPGICALADGGFVVAWESYVPSGGLTRHRIYGQRYDNTGIAVGGEFQVYANYYDQNHPKISALADGGFLVVWQASGDLATNVRAQRYNSTGAPMGASFQISDYSDWSSNPAITTLADGGFVVTWTEGDASSAGIYGQRYNNAGVVVGAQFRVNSLTEGNQDSSAVTALADGGFVVAWESFNQDGSLRGIVGQRFNANGEFIGLTDSNDTLHGGVGDDLLEGLGGNDVIYGHAGDDTLDGGAGTDTLAGGIGRDVYYLDSTTDVIIENTNEGIDTVHISQSYSLQGTNLEYLVLHGTGNSEAKGNQADNLLIGNAGNNILWGYEGNDVINGDAGADTARGGVGDDMYYVEIAGDVVIELADQGIDTVITSMSYSLGQHVENLLLQGDGNVSGTGNTLNNSLWGNDAANTLNGLAGQDTMSGAFGDDTYLVDNTGDVVTELVNQGVDTVKSSVDYSLTIHVENLTLQGSAVQGNGNGLSNILLGNQADNKLLGLAGNDNLIGGTGNDTLNGGVGIDTLNGGVGDDWLSGGSGADSLYGSDGDDVYFVDDSQDKVFENSGAGTDRVVSSVDYVLGNHVEKLILSGSANLSATGNTLSNLLTGNDGNNQLVDAAGLDSLFGGLGDDVLTGGVDNDVVNGGDGNDTYIQHRGDGLDHVFDSSGAADVLSFDDASISRDQLWFRHVGQSLEITIIGTTDKVLIQNWYADSTYQVEEIHLQNGSTLTSGQVENLVSAMSTMSRPPLGQTTLTTAQHNQLDGVIAANWS